MDKERAESSNQLSYETLAEDLKDKLPSVEDLEAEFAEPESPSTDREVRS